MRPVTELGELYLSGEGMGIRVRCTHVSLIEGTKEAMLIGMVAPGHRIRAIKAFMTTSRKGTLHPIACPLTIGEPGVTHGPDKFQKLKEVTSLNKSSASYHFYAEKIKYSQFHAIMVSRFEGFMVTVDRETIWQELKEKRYTTPIAEEWVPYLTRRMFAAGLLKYLPSMNCRCGLMTARTKDLDGYVKEGLFSREIVIPRNPAHLVRSEAM